MVAVGGLAKLALVAVLAASRSAASAVETPAEPPTPPGAEIELSAPRYMQLCESGGMGAPECEIDCRRIFNFYTSSCGVTCRSGYFACCNCDNGCHCLMDHEEMWPLPDPGPAK